MDVRLDLVQQLGFEQHLAEVQSLECILLHNSDHRGRKERADVAEPPRDLGIGPAKACLAVRVVERPKHIVELDVLAPKLHTGAVRLFPAEHEPPPPQPLVSHRCPPAGRAEPARRSPREPGRSPRHPRAALAPRRARPSRRSGGARPRETWRTYGAEPGAAR